MYDLLSILVPIIIQPSTVLNKIKLWLEFHHERGVYKYDEGMINVRLMYDEIMT